MIKITLSEIKTIFYNAHTQLGQPYKFWQNTKFKQSGEEARRYISFFTGLARIVGFSLSRNTLHKILYAVLRKQIAWYMVQIAGPLFLWIWPNIIIFRIRQLHMFYLCCNFDGYTSFPSMNSVHFKYRSEEYLFEHIITTWVFCDHLFHNFYISTKNILCLSCMPPLQAMS